MIKQSNGKVSGLPFVLLTQFGERFSFYGIKSILIVYMTNYLLDSRGILAPMGQEQSKVIFHLFMSVAYIAPIIGAILSDIWLGKFRAILIYLLIYCTGLWTLASDPTKTGLFVGLFLIALSSGAIKPCLSAKSGDQVPLDESYKLNKTYNWFYFLINLGAFLAILSVPLLLDKFGPRIAIGFTFMGLILTMLFFALGHKKYIHIKPDYRRFKIDLNGFKRSMAFKNLLIIYFFVSIFFALKGQTASSWVLQAMKMDLDFLGFHWVPAQIQIANSLYIIILIPMFYIFSSVNKTMSALSDAGKIAIGLLLTAIAFGFISLIEFGLQRGVSLNVAWQLIPYLFITLAEVLISVSCLHLSYKQSPSQMKSFVMAIYFLAIAFGNIMTAVVNILIKNSDGSSKLPGASYYLFFTIIMLIAFALFFGLVRKNEQNKVFVD